MIKILRKLTLEDATVYKQIRMRAFMESSSSFSESYEDEVDKPSEFFQQFIGADSEHFTVGAFINETLAGIATFKRDKRAKARHKSFIHTMFVVPEARGQGIAQEILSLMMKEARMLSGLEQIHLWVLNPEISSAKKLYLKNGFVTNGALVKKDLIIDGKYVDAEYMTMELC